MVALSWAVCQSCHSLARQQSSASHCRSARHRAEMDKRSKTSLCFVLFTWSSSYQSNRFNCPPTPPAPETLLHEVPFAMFFQVHLKSHFWFSVSLGTIFFSLYHVKVCCQTVKALLNGTFTPSGTVWAVAGNDLLLSCRSQCEHVYSSGFYGTRFCCCLGRPASLWVEPDRQTLRKEVSIWRFTLLFLLRKCQHQVEQLLCSLIFFFFLFNFKNV